MRATGAREAQRIDVAARLGAGRATAVIGPAGGEGAQAAPDAPLLAPEVFLRAGAPDADVLIALDPIAARLVLPVATALGRRAAGGASVVLAVGAGVEALVAPSLPMADVFRQSAVEAVWIGSGQPDHIDVPAAGAGAAIRVLFVVGGAAVTGDTVLARAAVHVPHHLALEHEVAELRSANARLRSSHRPVESAAAGALVSRVAALQQQLDATIDAARSNDQLFQEARDVIGLREQEIRGLRKTLARPQHRAAASAGHHVGRLPLVARALRRVLNGRS